MKLSRILVPVDASDTSSRALKFAANLAEEMGAKLDVLHVTYFTSETDAQDESWLPDDVVGDVRSDEVATQAMIKRCMPDDFQYEYHRRTGMPAEEILQFAEESLPDLIVTGGRGLGVVEGFFAGSVSQELVERAQTAVMVVK
ncbi:Nucleotide-binding universal stress protein, UspA family [Selenomonas ruminantium]|uniref:Nucleotide-binding universal stress protein, UspA family n=1 Tax=Selenomonas ruminantium TaxID=971 RepID=A0A1M6TLR7_SELRU|nr:universal stress protein [Selenomonas ruminantium]SHK57907.1 Nucleotide-binding universal stress protein, UspA family [Selenomonas ruminantium]